MLEFKKEQENDLLIKKYKKITNIISIFRLLILISMVLFIILMISLKEFVLYGILAGFSFVLFIAFVLLTNRFYNQYDEYKYIKLAYERHNERRKLNLNKFYDLGEDFLEKDGYEYTDLDIFGKNSIYQYISLCKTKEGRNRLANYLKHGNKDQKLYQDLLFDLKDNENIISLEASLNKFGADAKNFSKDNINKSVNSHIKLNIFSFLPLISFIGLIIYAILVLTIKLNPYFLFLFLGTNLVLSKLCLRNEIFELDSSRIYSLCDSYLLFSKKIINFESKNEYFNEIKEKIKTEYNNLNNIKKIYSILAMRKNIVFNIVTNLIFSFDFFIIVIYNKLSKNSQKLDELFDSVGIIEVVLSFLNLIIDQNTYTRCITTKELKIVDGIHPLINNCIPNSIIIDGGIILTGSNMSGKTTFMRMVGVNQILKNACGIALAKEFSSPNILVNTSLRINDLLQEGISTFYAEILRMKKINTSIKKGKILVLVDEIFKGTNHDERIEAAFKLIEKLNELGIYFIISTHDFELSKAKNIKNYHFAEDYIKDKLYFDYKIKEGVSKSKNAMYLLHLADII